MRNFTNKELKELFDGRRVSSVLPYENLEAGSEMNKLIKEGNGRLSISGTQEKYAVVEESGALRLTYKMNPAGLSSSLSRLTDVSCFRKICRPMSC